MLKGSLNAGLQINKNFMIILNSLCYTDLVVFWG